MEGNGFRDRIREFEEKNVQILGCSFDTVEENRAFAEKRGYTFPLLCDTEREVGLAYAACDEKDAGFARRISYVIDEQGKIAHALPKVNPATHTKEMLALVG
ncbi:MAG: hypothetical protein D6760_01505 [Deltaproteobacteria bacterium]|nr:MAG: hypothetical protein D6760_01505 [Deltaproteobacteria bacterium]